MRNSKLEKKVLMVAFHYPPYEGGSGVHRTLKFSKYLPEHGWQPIILSAFPKAYPRTGIEQLAQISQKVIVERAFALDTARHLSLRGRYLRLMALPDQWASWWWGGVLTGLKLVRKYRPSIIWSTYPIATAHLIGLTLQRLTGLPWVADFRDSMTEENYPRDKWSRRSYLWVERRVVRYGSRLVFTAPSALKMYQDRYPALVSERCVLISNGYDDEDFIGLPISKTVVETNGRPIRVVHAGLIYTDDRDPRGFFNALSTLKSNRKIGCANLKIDLRASGSEDYYRKLITELDIDDIVRLLPALPHRKSIEDCADADALLLFQAASCNHQIPAKIYEYLRLGKPILGLTPEDGDTGRLLKEVGGATVVDLVNAEEIYRAIPAFLTSIRNGLHPFPDAERINCYSRKYQTGQLAACLAELLPRTKTGVDRG